MSRYIISVPVLCLWHISHIPSTLGKITRQLCRHSIFHFRVTFLRKWYLPVAHESHSVSLGRVSGGKDELPRRKSASLYGGDWWSGEKNCSEMKASRERGKYWRGEKRIPHSVVLTINTEERAFLSSPSLKSFRIHPSALPLSLSSTLCSVARSNGGYCNFARNWILETPRALKWRKWSARKRIKCRLLKAHGQHSSATRYLTNSCISFTAIATQRFNAGTGDGTKWDRFRCDSR